MVIARGLTLIQCGVCQGEGVIGIEDEQSWEARMAHDIIINCAVKHDVTVAQIIGRGRENKVCAARFEAMHEMRIIRMTMDSIGRYLGNRDHSSIFYGLKVHRACLDVDAVEDSSAAVAGLI